MPTTLKEYQARTIEIDHRISEREKEQRAEQARRLVENHRHATSAKVPDAYKNVAKNAQPTGKKQQPW